MGLQDSIKSRGADAINENEDRNDEIDRNYTLIGGEANQANAVGNGIIGMTDSNSVTADGRHGHIGRSMLFDPFKRTRNVPFRVAGRRNSICVFNTIEEIGQ